MVAVGWLAHTRNEIGWCGVVASRLALQGDTVASPSTDLSGKAPRAKSRESNPRQGFNCVVFHIVKLFLRLASASCDCPEISEQHCQHKLR